MTDASCHKKCDVLNESLTHFESLCFSLASVNEQFTFTPKLKKQKNISTYSLNLL